MPGLEEGGPWETHLLDVHGVVLQGAVGGQLAVLPLPRLHQEVCPQLLGHPPRVDVWGTVGKEGEWRFEFLCFKTVGLHCNSKNPQQILHTMMMGYRER